MADTYTKGTRAWFPDKELGWISAEVTTATTSGESLKLTFVDERGKVPSFFPRVVCFIFSPTLFLTLLNT